jgi:hypothetical protein
MSIQENYCKQMRLSGPESLPLNQQTKFDVLIQIETLSGCYHNCVGCFVDKNLNKSMSDKMLERAKEISDQLEMVHGLRSCKICGTNPEKQREQVLTTLL